MAKGESLRSELGKSALDVGTDYAEAILDQWLDNGVLRELPAIRTVIGIGKGLLSMRDSLFLRKIKLFVESIDKHTQEERERFARDLGADPKYRDRVLDAILLIIDQLDDTEKAVLFARALSALVRNEIVFYSFRRYGEIIKAANVTHLQNLFESIEQDGEVEPRNFLSDQVLPLLSLGLVDLAEPDAPFRQQTAQKGMTCHVPTDFGRKFVRTVIRKEDLK